MTTCGDADVPRTRVNRDGGRRFHRHWNGCHARDCPVCQRRVQINRDGEFKLALGWLDRYHPRMLWSEMVLSLADGPVWKLRENLVETRRCFGKLIRSNLWTPSGWAWRFEAKKDKEGHANGHLHVLAVACECCSVRWDLASGYGLGLRWREAAAVPDA